MKAKKKRKRSKKKNQWGWSMSSYQKRRISEQTYKFPKCIFSIFSSSQYTIYIYFLYDVVQLKLLGLLLLEHEFFFFSSTTTTHHRIAECYVSDEGMRGNIFFPRSVRRKQNEGADWEKLRKINMWVIRKHKYWMLRLYECGGKKHTNFRLPLSHSAANLEGFME